MSVILTFRRQKNQKFKVIPSYTVSLGLTLKPCIEKKKEEEKEKSVAHATCVRLYLLAGILESRYLRAPRIPKERASSAPKSPQSIIT